MVENEYIDRNTAYDYGTLEDWFINSISQDDTPVWTKEHLEELLNDFYVIPKDTPVADVVPVTHGTLQHTGSSWSHLWRCTNCNKIAYYPPKGNRKKRIIQPCNYKYCPNCGAKMDGKDG